MTISRVPSPTNAACFILAAGAVLSAASLALAQNTIRAAMLSGSDAVPGVGSGALFLGSSTGAVLLDDFLDGRVAFAGKTTGTPASGIWREALSPTTGILSAVVLQGDPTPGASGGTFGALDNTRLVGSDNGHLAFSHQTALAGSPIGLWTHDATTLSLFAFTGQASPTSPAGTWNLNFILWPTAMSRAGSLAAVTAFASGGTYLGAFSGSATTPGTITMCARTELSLTDGFASFSTPQIRSDGHFALPASVRVGGTTKSGLFSGACGTFAPIVLSGDVIPANLGLLSGSLFLFPTNLGASDGTVAFISNISGGGVTISSDTALWRVDAGVFTLVAREGEQVPGLPSGTLFGDFKTGGVVGPIASKSGDVAFAGFLTGPAVTTQNNRAIIRNVGGTTTVVLRSGQTPPEYASGTIQSFGSGLAMNDAGQLCVGATIASPPVGRGGGVFITATSGGTPTLLFESGLSWSVRPGVTATIGVATTDVLTSGGTDGLPRNWNNRGALAFRAPYSIGATGESGSGVFIVAPPVCRADFNGDGFLDFTDFDDFVTAFEAGLAISDFNGDGFLDFTDFDDFVAAFESGC